MGHNFRETSVNKMDKKKYDENYAQIDWGNNEALIEDEETELRFRIETQDDEDEEE